MNIFKAALISIRRRRLNSIILMLVVFILANVIFTAYAVTASLGATRESVLADQIPTATITLDYGDGTTEPPPSRKYPLRSADVQTLYNKTKDMVKSYDYNITSGTSIPKDYKIFSIEGFEMFGPDSELEYISISGTQQKMTSLVTNGQAKLISGKGFSEADIEKGNDVVIITKQLAESTGLNVGDMFPTIDQIRDFSENGGDSPILEEIKNEYKIVGIIQIDSVENDLAKYDKIKDKQSQEAQSSDMFTVLNQINSIHMPNSTVNKINKAGFEVYSRLFPEELAREDYDPNKAEDSYISPTFLLKDINDLDEFTKIAKEVYSKDSIIVESARSNYDKVAKPLESMNGLLKTILLVTVISGIVIISLILCIFIYLRQKEIGIILALGQRKIKIVLQLLFESLMVAVVGAVVAIASGYFISNAIANNTVEKMLTSPAPQDNVYFGNGMPSSFDISAEAISKQFENGITLQVIGIFLAIMIATIVIAQLITVLYLLRLKPRKILM